MTPSARTKALIALAVAALATAAFIFVHASQGVAASWNESGMVATLLEPILRRLYGLAGKIVGFTGHAWTMEYETFVRRCAHLIEYSLIGAECTAICAVLARRAVSPYLWASLFIVLAIAVVDEYVQSLVGRTGTVGDVLFDFAGASFGIVVAVIVMSLLLRRSRR